MENGVKTTVRNQNYLHPWILKFTMTLLIGNIAQQLYNTVDSIIVGRFVGDNAPAAADGSL